MSLYRNTAVSMSSKRIKPRATRSGPTTANGRKSSRREEAVPEQDALPEEAARSDPSESSPRLAVEVVWGDITKVKAHVYAVGHYIGMPPLKAERALDRAISGWQEGDGDENNLINQLTRRGAIRGALGEVLFFPWDPDRVVAVAGMGRAGCFRAGHLRALARSVARSVGLLPRRETIATVLVGSGPGNLPVQDAALGLVQGIVETLADDQLLKVSRLSIVEMWLDRAVEIHRCLQEGLDDKSSDLARLLQRSSGLNIKLETKFDVDLGGMISPEFGCSLLLASLANDIGEDAPTDVKQLLDRLQSRLPYAGLSTRVRDRLGALKAQCDSLAESERLNRLAMSLRLQQPDEKQDKLVVPSRLAFWSDGQQIRTAAITDTVAVTERIIPGRLAFVDLATDRLVEQASATYSASEQVAKAARDARLKVLARRLPRLLVHTDVRNILRSELLVIEVDRGLARVPWEVISIDSEEAPLAVTHSMARQLRTTYSARPDDLPPPRHPLKALVVGGPGDPDQVNEQATHEAKEIRDLLQSLGLDVVALIGAPADGTGAGPFSGDGILPADLLEVVDELQSGNYDIVHYCGHAIFDPNDPERAGWLFKDGRVLTAFELEGMERPPRLIVANACLSAQLSQRSSGHRREADLVASLADEFFRRGVSDYIGTAWEVPTVPAREFTRVFYTALHSGKRLGEAVRLAREALHSAQDEFGPVWAAYQHYGDPTREFRFT